MNPLSVEQMPLTRLSQAFESSALKLDSLLYAVLNAMIEGIVLIDPDGQVALANPRVEMIGLTPAQLSNQPIEALLDKQELKLAARMGFASVQDLRALLKKPKITEPFCYHIEEKDQTIYIQRRVIPVTGSSGESVGLLLVFYNQTEEHDLEQARDDLTSMIVHDLRSPLSSVNSGLKLLRELIPGDSPLFSTIESTAEASQRAIRKLLNRVNSLLDVSRMDRGQWMLEVEPTDLATIAENVCREFTPLARELEVDLKTEIKTGLTLSIDPDKVERVLLNLVDNALKFCPAEGAVTIHTYAPEVSASGEKFVRVDVMDTGPGVPDEYKTKLFERFMQIKGRRGARRGIGLGLTFCRMVVEAHGGSIWIEDNPSGGSIFAFTLPVAKMDDVD